MDHSLLYLFFHNNVQLSLIISPRNTSQRIKSATNLSINSQKSVIRFVRLKLLRNYQNREADKQEMGKNLQEHAMFYWIYFSTIMFNFHSLSQHFSTNQISNKFSEICHPIRTIEITTKLSKSRS